MKEIKEDRTTFDKSFWRSLLIFILVVILVCFFPFLLTRDSTVFDFRNTGQIGDTIGGIMGPFVGIAAAILTFLAFWVQFKANEQQKKDLLDQKQKSSQTTFETIYFQLIGFHRDNVNELRYTKFTGEEFRTSENRKVLRDIFSEFIECYRDVRKFSNSKKPLEYLTPKYIKQLNEIKEKNNIYPSLIEMAIIDISYSITFFGLGVEGETVLRDRFKGKYNGSYYFRLLAYLKLKPKRENAKKFKYWSYLKTLPLIKMRSYVDDVYYNRNSDSTQSNLGFLSRNILANTKYEKYYGGHQHRLGHYFRHLFQTFKFLNNNEVLSEDEKYLFGKILRGQLSTYEQALLLINSISSLGMKWELKFQPNEKMKHEINYKIGLITKYKLIKNLPGNHFFGITYKKYYPQINYESNDD